MSEFGPASQPPTTSSNSKPNPNDKRYLPRWKVNSRVLYHKQNNGAFHECKSANINAEGACITTTEALPVDQILDLIIYLTPLVSIHVEGKVLWSVAKAQENMIGLQLINVSEKTQEMILQYAFDFNKDALIKHWFKGW